MGDPPNERASLAPNGAFRGCALFENVLAFENRLPIGRPRPVARNMSSGPRNMPGSVLGMPDELAILKTNPAMIGAVSVGIGGLGDPLGDAFAGEARVLGHCLSPCLTSIR